MAVDANESNGSLREKSLRKKRVNKEHNSNFRAGYVHIDEDYLHRTGLRGRKICCFITVLIIMLVIILINLLITIMLLSVLKINIWSGMAGLEFTHNPRTGASIVKFLQHADLGNIITPDDTLSSFQQQPLHLQGFNKQAVIVGASYRTLLDSDRITPEVSSGMSYCESERQSILEHLATGGGGRDTGPAATAGVVVVPSCDRQGLYEAVQCQEVKARTYCWCVNVQTGHALTDKPHDVTHLHLTSSMQLRKLLDCPQQKHNITLSSLSVSPDGISMNSIDALRLYDRDTRQQYFSSKLGGASSLVFSDNGQIMELIDEDTGRVYYLQAKRLKSFHNAQRIITNKVSSGNDDDDLRIQSPNDTVIINGNEELSINGKQIGITSRERDINIRSQFGGILLSGSAPSVAGSVSGGIRINPEKLSLAGEVSDDVDGFLMGGYGEAYKLCICLPRGNLFLVKVREAFMGCDTANENYNPCL